MNQQTAEWTKVSVPNEARAAADVLAADFAAEEVWLFGSCATEAMDEHRSRGKSGSRGQSEFHDLKGSSNVFPSHGPFHRSTDAATHFPARSQSKLEGSPLLRS